MRRPGTRADRWLRRLDPIYRREQVEDEIQEEMRFHLDQRAHENRLAGMDPEQARRAALGRFGDLDTHQQSCRTIHGIRPPRQQGDPAMGILLQDLSYGFRTLVRNPGFTVITVLTIALGLGANTAIFSVIRTVLLAPLPYERPEELQQVWGFHPEIGTEAASLPDFVDWRGQNEVFVDLAAAFRRSMNLTGDGAPERVLAARVSASLFSVLGVSPALGRGFLAEEEQPDGPRVAILSYGLWERRFGARQDILAQSVELDGEPYTVVGVAPPGFEYPSRAQVWLPLALDLDSNSRRADFLLVVGRLAPGVGQERAQAAMDSVAQHLEEQYPATNTHWGVRLVPLHEELVGSVRPTLLALFGAVAFVLLIACANVANLLLNRALDRDELVVRAALGAGKIRLLRQLLTESLLLFSFGGLGGLGLGWVGIWLLAAHGPSQVPRLGEVSLDIGVAAFCLGLALLSGLLSSLAPALQALRGNLGGALRNAGTRTVGGQASPRLRNLLVIGEIALSLVLLIGAGLMIRSLQHLQAVDPGFDPKGLLSMGLSLPSGVYAEPARTQAFFDELESRVGALPAARSVGAVSGLYIAGGAPYLSFLIEGRPAPGPEELADAQVRTVTPGFFRTLGVPLLRGEPIAASHTAEAPRVALINQALARSYFPEVDPIGQRLAFDGTDAIPEWRQVIGVMGDVKQEGLDKATYPEIYVPLAQNPRQGMTLVVRTAGDPMALAGPIRAEVLALDENQPIYAVQTMEQAVRGSLGHQRFAMFLLALFAAVALVLAAVGMYGVISYSVGQRTREIGVRIAMGAGPRDILRLVLINSLALTACGLTLGLGAATLLTRYLDTLLFEVEATDPMAFWTITILLALVATFASLLPARRAMRIEPVDAVRGD